MTTPQAVRVLNEARALSVLYHNGTMSRADLARALDMTRSTASSLISQLLADGLVVERLDAERGEVVRTGRPGIAISIRPEGAFFLGAEIGVGYVIVVGMDLSARIVARRRVTFAIEGNRPDEVIRLACQLVRAVIADLPDASRIRGLCVTVPGLHDHRGVLLTGPFLGWRNVPVAELVRGEFGDRMPVLSENDANAFAIAEIYASPSDETKDLLCLFMDYGIGAGIVAGGRLFRGRHGYSGEVGHMVVAETGVIHRLDPPGRWENLVGAEAVLERWRQAGGSGATIGSLVQALQDNQRAAWEAAEHWAYWLGRGLASVANVIDPGHVVLGGSVARLYPFVADLVHEALRRHVFEDYQVPSLALARHTKDGPAIGAACLLHQEMLSLDLISRRRERWKVS
ncbi:MAG TPA: ROK family transcriptional regulator [Geminicoccus sp.]|uniref:ROK family transcriptional regulator n=1 Tax=Geminicoccus sp. TaxID=2024832 RepID=UPI002E2F9850|nr:ROK family transcriptional regulator [Geminicoccus sp.]HEX2525152.1 ROK family transcriptional regulator [Geminicoccus sp.]